MVAVPLPVRAPEEVGSNLQNCTYSLDLHEVAACCLQEPGAFEDNCGCREYRQEE